MLRATSSHIEPPEHTLPGDSALRLRARVRKMGSDNAKRAKLLSQWPAEKLVVLPLMFAMLLCTVGIAIAQYEMRQ